jgi:glycosyltransferase involved in cell wall biosynthesis
VKLDVLLPVYNGELYLEYTINSILKQTFSNFRFIICNDASMDLSSNIIKRFSERDERITYVENSSNIGIVETRNKLIDMSSAELIAWIDQDDISLQNRLDLQFNYMKYTPDCVAVGSSYWFIDPEGRRLMEMNMPSDHQKIVEAALIGKLMLPQPGSMMRRNAVIEVGGYRKDYELAEDLDLILRISRVGSLSNVPDSLLHHRQHLSSAGHRGRFKQTAAAQAAVAVERERRGLPPLAFENLDVRLSKSDQLRIWSWWAAGSGEVATAHRHMLAAFFAEPFNRRNWLGLSQLARMDAKKLFGTMHPKG